MRARRRQLDLQQAELAELARCSTRSVHAIEAGKPTVRLDKLLAVLGALGLGLMLVPGAGIQLSEDPSTTGRGER
ncbi:MAG: helix-turn-helix domain-containing protein [Planctomycetes bacterium]|nr:helix-turn-helix domain-containing protein [Planctomycetota bacterium]